MSTVASNPPTMQCMEVWGGNAAIDNGVVMPGLDAWVYAKPYKEQAAGGDIHYVSSCATGRIVRLLVADVSGHGDEVADTARALRSLMRRYINYLDQSKLIRGLNTEFTRLSEMSRFATAVVATYWSPTDELHISNAGHPRPLWYRARTQSWHVLDTKAAPDAGLSNIPLGIAEPTTYDQMSVKLGAGDLVLIYTDALVEAAASDRRLLGEAGLLEIVRSIDVNAPESFIASLLSAIRARTGMEFGDDVTALLLRPNTLKPRAGLGMGLMAGYRIARSAVRSLFRKEPVGLPETTMRNFGGAFVGRLNRD
ncbi:MAG: serine/threonine-protein phosphatase [Phycisphaeraceae bacterium]|nr:serine/threonine-protein phosphatase [Phycisphaeraceae bacterium]